MARAGTQQSASGAAAGGDRFRLLVVATESVAGEPLNQEVERYAADRDVEVRIVAPALTDSPLRFAMGDVDEAIETADERLEESLDEAGRAGISAQGTIGDADPMLAIEDALRTFPADEIVIFTRPGESSRWLEGDLFDRAKARFEPPVVHIVLAGDGGAVQEVERSGRGAEEADTAAAKWPRNAPPVSRRDMGGIAVAVIGSIALILLAINCPGGIEGGTGTSTACVAELIIAAGMALINIAHVVGLLLFQSVRYRGLGERVFADLSLWGTPAAIVVIGLITLIAH